MTDDARFIADTPAECEDTTVATISTLSDHTNTHGMEFYIN